MPLGFGDEEDISLDGTFLPYSKKYPKIDLPNIDKEYWLCNRYALYVEDDNGPYLVIIDTFANPGPKSHTELYYRGDCYLVKRSFCESVDELKNLLNEIKNKIDEYVSKGLDIPQYKM